MARATGLYGSISCIHGFYEENRRCGTCLYTDHMIFCPAVPVFHDDNDRLIRHPFDVCILTASALNKEAMLKNEPERLPEVEPGMLARIDRVPAIAVAKGYRHLVLGAWGCGVFRNTPSGVADWFAIQLRSSAYRHAFDVV